MVLQNKYENISRNAFVLGADIIKYLRKDSASLNKLFSQFHNSISLTNFLNVLTFLYIAGIIDIDKNNHVFLNETEKTLHNPDSII
ncbi:MAG: ABC-three component system middle component 6 [Bacteroidota bacterium]